MSDQSDTALTADEAATLLKVSTKTLLRLARSFTFRGRKSVGAQAQVDWGYGGTTPPPGRSRATASI